MTTDGKCEFISRGKLAEMKKRWDLIWDKVEARWPNLSVKETFNVTTALLNKSLELK